MDICGTINNLQNGFVEKYNKCTAHASMFLKSTDGAKFTFMTVISLVEGLELKGFDVARFLPAISTLKTYNETIVVKAGLKGTDEILEGRAFKSSGVERLLGAASKLTFLVYQILGMVKLGEKLELISAGVGNMVTSKLFNQSAEATRSVFGTMGCSFALLEISSILSRRGWNGLDLDAGFAIAINVGRIICFSATKGQMLTIATGGIVALVSIVKTIYNQKLPTPQGGAAAA